MHVLHDTPESKVRIFAALPDSASADIHQVIDDRVRESPLIHWHTWFSEAEAYECAYDLHMLTVFDDLWDCVKRASKGSYDPNAEFMFEQETIRHLLFGVWPLLAVYPNAVIHRLAGFCSDRLELIIDCDGNQASLDDWTQTGLTPFQREVRYARCVHR